MARKSRSTIAPFDVWTPFWNLATAGTEMAIAATQTIGHRVNMLAGAGDNPTARERREFFRMGSEKLEAAFDSANAMSGSWNVLGRQMNLLAKAQGQLLSATAGLTTARTFQEMTTAQQRYWEALTKGGEATLAVWAVGMKIAQRGLLPIHAKATANAKRLGLTGSRR